jgi:hypothetical protein
MTKIIKELVFGVPRTGEKIFAKDKIEIKSTYPKKWTGSDSEYFVWCREYRVGILTDKTKFIFS